MKQKVLKHMPIILGMFALALVVLLTVMLIQHFSEDQPKPKKVIQQITLIAPPPPPPPPPQEKPPEPEIQEEIVEEEMDEAMPEDLGDEIASEDLGIDADGAAGSDSFGLIGRKGGRGFLGGTSPYAVQVQTLINDLLSGNEKLKYMAYSATLKLWITESGLLERYELDQRSGDPEAKIWLEKALADLSSLNSPPLEMPQPIKLRLRSEL